MDCCNTKDEKGCCSDFGKSDLFGHTDKKNSEEPEKLKGGNRKMNSRITLWVAIGVLFVAALFLTFKAGAVGSVESVQTASSVAKSAASSSGMVGGC